MTRLHGLSRLVLAVATGLGLAACQTMDDGSLYRHQVKEPQVHFLENAHVVHFEKNSAAIGYEETQNLNRFLGRIRRTSSDRLTLAVAKTGETSNRRLATIARMLAESGALGSGEQETKVDPRLPADAVRVGIGRHVVTLPGCPDWTKRADITWDNQVHSNWGCASAVNLGLMVADPRDLVVGREAGPMDGEAAAMGVRNYRLNAGGGSPDSGGGLLGGGQASGGTAAPATTSSGDGLGG